MIMQSTAPVTPVDPDPFYVAADRLLDLAELITAGYVELHRLAPDGSDILEEADPVDQAYHLRDLLYRFSSDLRFFRRLPPPAPAELEVAEPPLQSA